MKRLTKYYYSGYTLIFALVIMIVVACFALLFMASLQLNGRILNNVQQYTFARKYCYQGLLWLDTGGTYNKHYTLHHKDGYNQFLLKEKWGVFDLYFSNVSYGDRDTLFSKIALIGYAKDSSMGLALFLRNTKIPFYISDSVIINGKCYVPSGIIRQYGSYRPSKLTQEQQTISPDTLIKLRNLDRIITWVNEIEFSHSTKINITDTINASFTKPTVILNADTVIVSGKLMGNIIIRAQKTIITPIAQLTDIIIISNYIRFPDNFFGQLQAMASDTIIVGNNAHFYYPSLLFLHPQLFSETSNNIKPAIVIGNSIRFSGEMYAYSSKQDINQRMKFIIGENSKITGGIYSSCNLYWQGVCHGTIIADKLSHMDMFTTNENLIKNSVIAVDSLSPFYTYSLLFPVHTSKKVIKWEK